MPMLRRDAMRRVGLRPPRMRVRRVTSFSINRMIPNVLTLLALCAGMSAIRYAVIGKFEAAVIAIIVAGILGGLDGRMARLLKANSSFGAQLDSYDGRGYGYVFIVASKRPLDFDKISEFGL